MSGSTSPIPGTAAQSPRALHLLRLWPGLVIVILMWLVRRAGHAGHPEPHAVLHGLHDQPAGRPGTGLYLVAAPEPAALGRPLSGPGRVCPGGRGGDRGLRAELSADDVDHLRPADRFVGLGGMAAADDSLRLAGAAQGLAALLVLSACCCMPLRVDGMDGSFATKFSFRWHPTPEQLLLQELAAAGPAAPASESANAPRWKPWNCNPATGPASAVRPATGDWWACGSPPIGINRPRNRSGGTASVPAGRRWRSSAIGPSPRNNAATTNWSPATTPTPAPRCGPMPTTPGSAKSWPAPARAARPPSTTAEFTPWGPAAS